MTEMTDAWRQYELGVNYKMRIKLYKTVDLNERFFAGDQWVGIPHDDLPTPVLNLIKYSLTWKIAAVADRRTSMSFYPEGGNVDGQVQTYARQISEYFNILWERLRMDYLTKEGLKQAAITGDYIQYFYWDDTVRTGQEFKGDIATQLVDNVNYYPGNPNSPDVQSQPYIILIFREHIDKVRAEAEKNGVSKEEQELINPDAETEYTSGDRGKIELDDNDKVNVLLKMWKKNGKVWFEKSTRSVVFQPEKESKLTRYPIALMNWETRKNSCHGEAEVTYLIPNQVFVNKILALSQLSQMQFSWPKVLYDRGRVTKWSNKVAGVIPVNGDPTNAAHYLTPPAMSYDAWRGMEATIEQTLRMMGASSIVLGDLKTPDNTSAFIAARDAAMVPLQLNQERFYAYLEDVGLIGMDFFRNFYKGGRSIPIMQNGRRVYVTIPDEALDSYEWRLKIEPGPSTTWGETQTLQTLDNLLLAKEITMPQYLERIPNGRIPMKEELINEYKQQTSGQTAQPQTDPRVADLMQRVSEGLKAGMVPQEVAQKIAQAAQQGAQFEELMEFIKQAVQQGQISPQFLQAA